MIFLALGYLLVSLSPVVPAQRPGHERQTKMSDHTLRLLCVCRETLGADFTCTWYSDVILLRVRN